MPDCPHDVIRQITGGACVLCGIAAPEPSDELAEAQAQLEFEAKIAAQELAALDADAARLDLGEFVRQGWHVLEPVELEWNWHHEALCRNVQAMFEEWLHRRDDKQFQMRWHKLAINICPSSLKSRIIMVFAVAWMWLRCPSWSVLCVSANPQNVTRDAEACRDLVTSIWYRETFAVTWSIREDIDSKAKFATTAGGVRISRGLIAKFTGIHVDGILIDDADDAHDVYSDAARLERAGKIEAISSRLNDKRHYVMIMTQQRVHVDDATGDAMSRGGWLHAVYPLLYAEHLRHDSPFFKDPRTEPGENLHPLRFTDEVIEAAKLELGTHGFEAQYNQNPSPLEGGMLKRGWFKFFRIQNRAVGSAKRPTGCNADEAETIPLTAKGAPAFDCLTLTVDATFGTISDTASAVGLLLVGNKGVKRYICLDRTRPMTFPQTKDAIRDLVREYPGITRILVEKKANGAAIIQDMAIEFGDRLIAVEPEGGKESRAAAMSPAIEAGSVYLLDGETWLDEFIAELCVFPHGKRDDRVDALSQLMTYYRETDEAQRWRTATSNLRSVVDELARRRRYR